MDYNTLILQAKSNNQQAFNALFDMLWDDVYHFLYKKTQNTQITEELSLDTFAKAFDRLDSYDTTFSFKTWLFTIAKNNHIDLLRKQNKLNRVEIEPLETQTVAQELNTALSPEELLIKRQNLDALLYQIQLLQKDYQTVLKLRYFEGMTYKQMSATLKIPMNTVKVLLFRAKKMLAQTIENEKNKS